MFIKNWKAEPIEGTKEVKMVCSKCGNESNHQIYEAYGFGVGIIFMRKPLLAMKKYYFVCPICFNPTKQISKEQVNAHRI